MTKIPFQAEHSTQKGCHSSHDQQARGPRGHRMPRARTPRTRPWEKPTPAFNRDKHNSPRLQKGYQRPRHWKGPRRGSRPNTPTFHSRNHEGQTWKLEKEYERFLDKPTTLYLPRPQEGRKIVITIKEWIQDTPPSTSKTPPADNQEATHHPQVACLETLKNPEFLLQEQGRLIGELRQSWRDHNQGVMEGMKQRPPCRASNTTRGRPTYRGRRRGD
jgi:hypothetical protein